MDEPDQIDGLRSLQERLARLGTRPLDSARQSADLTAMASVRPLPGMRSKLRLAGALLAGLLIGSTGLAAADALPDPAQHVAHNVLDRVGVDVPDPERYHGPECGTEAKRNHGAYVRDDHTLAKGDCGKPIQATGRGGDDSDELEEPKADKGPCAGKPEWAGDKTLTPTERATLQAERQALCGDEADAGDAPDAPGLDSERPDDDADEPGPEVTTTTTAEAPT
ncbi:MAG: hypothetical protein ACOYXM_07205, partial [Actinomycetota bacterium]